jgi:hypothetical protein
MKEIPYAGILFLAAVLLRTGYDAIGNDPCHNIDPSSAMSFMDKISLTNTARLRIVHPQKSNFLSIAY